MARFRNVIFFLLLFLVPGFVQEKRLVIDSLYVQEQTLCLDFALKNPFDHKMIDGLKHGFISEITYAWKLWKKRFLFSSLVSENTLSIVLYYDNWQDKYAVITEKERRLSSDLETIRNRSTRFSQQQLIGLAEMDKNAFFYISIQTRFQPISDQTYKELSSWLAGDGNEQYHDKSHKPGKLFPIFLDLIGVGDRDFSKSSGFSFRA